MFSKNTEVLDLMVQAVGRERPSTSAVQSGSFTTGDSSSTRSRTSCPRCPPRDRDRCLETFLDNPYSHYAAGKPCCQFFLATFGEGMTDLYLRPYNEKIWKFDPAFMDMQMVERIPKPPAEDILRSAKGEATEGYLHQLFFRYPKQGGIQALFDEFPAFARRQGDGPRQRPGATAAAARSARRES